MIKPYWSDGKRTVYCGDCRAVMVDFEPNSVDALVCDPPYGLEFMGKEWDKLGAGVESTPKSAGGFGKDSPTNENAFAAARIRYGKSVANMQEWHRLWAVEALRALKPGAHALVFGGTRTHHRLMCGLEDAGFEIRDCVMWVYGCLSEDTEILINGRWEPYHKAIADSHALCYNVADDAYSWQPIEAQFVYDYDETAYRITSEDTDQIVSRNHRCVIDRGRGWEFVLAEEAAREPEIHVPILEDLYGLLESLSGTHPLSGSEKQNVLTGLCREVELSGDEGSGQTALTAQRQDDQLRRVPQGEVEAQCLAPQNKDAYVFTGMQRSIARQGMGKARARGAGSLDARSGSELQAKDDRREQPCVEGRCDDLQEEGQLQERSLHSVSEGISTDGPQRRVCDGAPAFSSAGHRAMPASTRNGSSRRPRSDQQPFVEFDAICYQSGPQVIRASRHTRANLARIEPVHYTGKVWCVKVPTGAFVARRSGKVFITGNSGFPKSLDVSKAIDKAAGAKRETKRTPFTQNVIGGGIGITRPWKDKAAERGYHEAAGDIAVTDEAKQWNGWGTALKPAWEPVIVARKPLEQGLTVAQNVLKWGTGALNIDGCRIESEAIQGGRNGRQSGSTFNASIGEPQPPHRGRWPANLIHDGSDEVVNLFPNTQSAGNKNESACTVTKEQVYSGGWKTQTKNPNFHPDGGGSAARFFYSTKASGRDRGNRTEPAAPLFGVNEPEEFRNTHPTVKPIALMEYLIKLVMPPNGVLLDCFLGSGSTLVAAARLSHAAIGIERDKDSCAIAVQRLERA